MRRLGRGLSVLALAMAVTVCLDGAAWAGTGRRTAQRVSVQPIEGDLGPALRRQVASIVRGHGLRAVTSIGSVGGTGQYLTLARDYKLTALVTADLEVHKTRQTVTFLVWNGSNGSVLARWSASGAANRLGKAVAKGFWKHLKPAFEQATPPPSNELPPAPTMFVNAGEAGEE